MTEPNPSTRWFWNDWENDVGLKLCSLAAQGLWMRMLCLAAKSDPVGYVMMDGEPCTAGDLARLVGEPVERVQELIAELERRKVFSRNRQETIYNRRMVSQAKKSGTNKKNGSEGGKVSRDNRKGIFRSLGNATEREHERRTEHPAEQRYERPPERPPEPSLTPTSPRSPETPSPPLPPIRNSTSARTIAMRFIELRRELWSSDGEERIPILTLEADAEGYLRDGATEAAVLDVVERVMRRHAAAGKSEISSLRFFRNSIRDAMGQAKAANGSANGHAPADTPPHRVLLWQGRLATWLESGTWDKGWSIHDCPTAVVNEYRDRLKLKPPPGTSVAREVPDGEAA